MGAATGPDENSDSMVVLEGVVRKRRSLSRRLAFVDLETDDATSIPLVADGWALPKSIVAGLRVRVEGTWETSELRGRRLALFSGGINVLEDGRGENAWGNASTSAAWRARVRESATADATAVTAATDLGSMCLSWADLGRCSDSACVARHRATTPWEARRVARSEARRMDAHARDETRSGSVQAMRETEKTQEVPVTETDASVHGADAAKSKHNAVFARWLVDTFGVERLKGTRADAENAGGVVDIAGGRGLLSFELALEHGIPATLVEPKPLRVNKKVRKRVRKWRFRCGVSEISSDTPTVEDETVGDTANCISVHAHRSSVPVRHVRASFAGVDLETNEPETNEPEKSMRKEMVSVVRRAAVLVAMHPDQATDLVIETALRLRKPFAVVPCCVFADLNPHRLTKDGARVRTYDEMIAYYLGRNKDIRTARLAFEGRRQVLYRVEVTDGSDASV
jgi:hypothetical protein